MAEGAGTEHVGINPGGAATVQLDANEEGEEEDDDGEERQHDDDDDNEKGDDDNNNDDDDNQGGGGGVIAGQEGAASGAAGEAAVEEQESGGPHTRSKSKDKGEKAGAASGGSVRSEAGESPGHGGAARTSKAITHISTTALSGKAGKHLMSYTSYV